MLSSALNTKSYKDLIVYQKAFSNTISLFRYYKEQKLRWSEAFLVQQLLRALTSVGANIVEGYGRNSRKEYARFLSIAKGSSLEVEYWINIIVEIRPQDKEILTQIELINIEVIKILTKIIKTLKS